MKYTTIKFINDLLSDQCAYYVRRIKETEEQLDSLTSDKTPGSKGLAQELHKKYYDLTFLQREADEALEDFNNHQWI